jgi:hypothetical protein
MSIIDIFLDLYYNARLYKFPMKEPGPPNQFNFISEEKKRILDRIKACMPDDICEFFGVEGMEDLNCHVFAHRNTKDLLRMCAYYEDTVPGFRVAISGLLSRKIVTTARQREPKKINEITLEEGRGYGLNTSTLKALIKEYCDLQKSLSNKFGDIPRHLLLKGFRPEYLGPDQLVDKMIFKKGPIEIELKYPIQNSTILIRLTECDSEKIAELKKKAYDQGKPCRIVDHGSETFVTLNERQFERLPEVLDLLQKIFS